MSQEKKKQEPIPSAVKRHLQSQRDRSRNRIVKAKTNTAIRSLREFLDQGKKKEAQERLNHIFSLLDKGVKTKRVAPNKAARIKSRLAIKAYV